MRVSVRSVLITALLVAFSAAIAAQTLEVPAHWYGKSGGKDAVVLQFSRGGEAVSSVLVPEGDLASIRLADDKEALGFQVRSIDERGEGVRLGIYRIHDQYPVPKPGDDDWIEDIQLTKGGPSVRPEAAASYAGDPTLELRLVDSILATR